MAAWRSGFRSSCIGISTSAKALGCSALKNGQPWSNIIGFDTISWILFPIPLRLVHVFSFSWVVYAALPDA
jgi:hypothetical protein